MISLIVMGSDQLQVWELEAIGGFAQAVSVPDSKIDLARAALWIARAERPRLDIEAQIRRFNQMAEEIHHRMPADGNPQATIPTINRYLFEEQGFRGNKEHYFDPRNSYLDEVLERKLGIPLTLSLVYLEVGWRLAIPVEGVGFPGHFLVRCGCAQELILDAFNAGRLMTRESCEELLTELYGDKLPFDERFLDPVSKCQILQRMLGNLRTIYLQRNDFPRLLRTSEFLQRLTPDDRTTRRDRGLVLFRLGRLTDAYRELKEYLGAPESKEDGERIQACLREIRRRIAAGN